MKIEVIQQTIKRLNLAAKNAFKRRYKVIKKKYLYESMKVTEARRQLGMRTREQESIVKDYYLAYVGRERVLSKARKSVYTAQEINNAVIPDTIVWENATQLQRLKMEWNVACYYFEKAKEEFIRLFSTDSLDKINYLCERMDRLDEALKTIEESPFELDEILNRKKLNIRELYAT